MNIPVLLSNSTRSDLERIAHSWRQRLQRLQVNRVPGQNFRLDALITELHYRLAILTSIYVSTDSNLQRPPYKKASGKDFLNDFGIIRQAWMLPMEGGDKTPARRFWGK